MPSPAPGEEEAPDTHPNRLGDDWLESSFAEKAPGLLVDTGRSVSQQSALVAKAAISSRAALESFTSRSRVVILLLSHAASMSGVVCPCLGCSVQERLGHAGARPVKGHKDAEAIVISDV